MRSPQGTFQYLKGAIRGPGSYLKEYSDRVFQYLKGAIRGCVHLGRVVSQSVFQYLKGAIRGRVEHAADPARLNFNTSRVRLEVPREAIFEGTCIYISIPQGCD